MMKNLFTKLLLLIATVGLFAACDKDETKDPSNYIQIGKKKVEITVGTMFDREDPGSGAPKIQFSFLGKGITISETTPIGKGNMVTMQTPADPGEYSIDGNKIYGGYVKDVHIAGLSDVDEGVMGTLVEGSKIKWSKNGKVYTIDFEGNTTLEDGTAGEFLKVHFVGELLNAAADE